MGLRKWFRKATIRDGVLGFGIYTNSDKLVAIGELGPETGKLIKQVTPEQVERIKQSFQESEAVHEIHVALSEVASDIIVEVLHG